MPHQSSTDNNHASVFLRFALPSASTIKDPCAFLFVPTPVEIPIPSLYTQLAAEDSARAPFLVNDELTVNFDGMILTNADAAYFGSRA